MNWLTVFRLFLSNLIRPRSTNMNPTDFSAETKAKINTAWADLKAASDADDADTAADTALKAATEAKAETANAKLAAHVQSTNSSKVAIAAIAAELKYALPAGD